MNKDDVFDTALSVAHLLGHRTVIVSDGPDPTSPGRWVIKVTWVTKDGTKTKGITFNRSGRRSNAANAAVNHLSNLAIKLREARWKKGQ